MEPAPECGGESGRSTPSPTASPEFEFWMVGKNPSFPSPALLTADELFSGGVVLPLHTLQISPPKEDFAADADGDGDGEGVAVEGDGPLAEEAAREAAQPLAESSPAPTPDLPAVTFKWKDIFKASGGGEPKERKKVERRVSSVGGNAELININIWPFSRSRSAGHAAGGGGGSLSRARANAGAAAAAAATAAPAGRKVSSAPCSRSNSRGESSGPAVAPSPALATTSVIKRWVPGQGRAGPGIGIRLGRANPVWQLRRNKLQQQAAEQQKQNANAGGKTKATSADDSNDAGDGADDKKPNGNTCIGYRNKASCGGDGAGEESNPPPGLFGLRTFFSKKVY